MTLVRTLTFREACQLKPVVRLNRFPQRTFWSSRSRMDDGQSFRLTRIYVHLFPAARDE